MSHPPRNTVPDPDSPWLQAMAETLFRVPEHLDISQLGKAPHIDEHGRIVGETDPDVLPESREELLAGVKRIILHNPTYPSDSPLAIDSAGEWLSPDPTIRPETDAESHFLQHHEVSHG